jgi:hypothetical protein
VAALKWNGWQHSSGIGGNFEPEYALAIKLSEKGNIRAMIFLVNVGI